jgi:signal transduction histidine kinase/ActR/RegA family two-component response regulator
VRSRRKDGSLFEHEERLSPIRGDSGTMINYIMVSRDVTEEVRRELQLQQSRKMEAIGTLAGGIAHDFNNALAAIIGFSEMALNKTDDAAVRRRIEQVLKAGIRGRELVRQILTFARKTEQESKPVRLSTVINDILKLLRASFSLPIEIRYNVLSESGPVLADATQVHQVLMNLCANAYQSMHGTGGAIEILLSDYTLQPGSHPPHSDMQPGPYMALAVRDTGAGMESSVIERIFDPFFTTKKCGEGTGLGLSIVHTIVKNHGGAITVDSEVGKGSVFTVYLPRADSDEDVQADEASPVPTGSERVLFVDDEESLVEMGEEMLRELGYSVTAVQSGSKALELFRSGCHEFDLVITDLTMPDITGLELCRELLNIRPDMHIILVTGYADAAVDRVKPSGVSECVMKPLTRDELARVMRKVLDGRTGRTVCA